ncbi:MAG: beta-ketoacyl synthase N-terminal-like domain-containing protein, partial [Oceanobacter sp.]
MTNKRRVVVTGMGTVNPVGKDVASTWEALINGRSGISLIEHFDASEYATKIAGTIKDLDISALISTKEARKLDTFLQYAIYAAEEALLSANLPESLDKSRMGVAVGSGIGGLDTIEKNHSILQKSGPRRVSPFLVPA